MKFRGVWYGSKIPSNLVLIYTTTLIIKELEGRSTTNDNQCVKYVYVTL